MSWSRECQSSCPRRGGTLVSLPQFMEPGALSSCSGLGAGTANPTRLRLMPNPARSARRILVQVEHADRRARLTAGSGRQMINERSRRHRAAEPPRYRWYPRERTRQQKCSRSDGRPAESDAVPTPLHRAPGSGATVVPDGSRDRGRREAGLSGGGSPAKGARIAEPVRGTEAAGAADVFPGTRNRRAQCTEVRAHRSPGEL